MIRARITSYNVCYTKLLRAQGALSEERLAELVALVNWDLNFRARVSNLFNLSLAHELFYFGRPIFQLLAPLGFKTVNTPAGLRLMQSLH